MKHTISVLVENRPGVLARVAGLFARRGFNIHSLAVGITESPDVSRMTIVVDLPERPLEHVTKQLYKLINVLKVIEMEPGNSVERELMLVKVTATPEARSQIFELVHVFRAKIVDVSNDAMTVEVTGSPEKLHAFEDLVSDRIIELVKTGRVALARGSKSIKDRTLRVAG
ncbi:MAG: acetolactate synthase small subunit [Actinomycetota bacterium]|nr:acetolactate synthase small subunit [Actinomycetota bacterium]